MSFDKPTRNLLSKIVAKCRDLLAADVSDQLQSIYGLYADGSNLEVARTDAERRAAGELKALWEHYAASGPGEKGKVGEAEQTARLKAAYPRLVREIGFTLLNRLAALRLCEERGLLIECVRKGMESAGFRLYDTLAKGALGGRYETYRAFLESLFDELALDLGVLFDRSIPYSHIFPSETTLAGVLAELNSPELDARQIWQQDETIGWIYQYYNDPAERKKMRSASRSPRNSRELAVRNQFFTPRYVVEFLTDNTLGRTWYEMRQGETHLTETCRYLVRRKKPVFMAEGQTPPEPYDPARDASSDPDLPGEMWTRPNPDIEKIGDIFAYALTFDGYDYAKKHLGRDCGELANERLHKYHETGKWDGSFEELRCCLFFEQRRYHHYGRRPEGEDEGAILALYRAICERWDWEVEFIPFREKKDPRDLKILDPACGSGHFLLYAFDLLLFIYEEAWADADLPPSKETRTYLAQDYPDLEALRRAAPGLILRHNLHGIDIDPRAVQIAALALWLRAQRAYQELKLRPAERPSIEKSNIVVAEPMPGDPALREEFLQKIQQPFIRYLVETVFEKMELAGEAGSLLKIEEEIREPIRQARQQWLNQSKAEQLALWPENRRPKAEQLSLFTSGISDASFWDRAEEMVLEALHKYSLRAQNGKAVRRRLFVQDTEQGFAFIDLCQSRFDAILMNPPFGEVASRPKTYIEDKYSKSKGDILANFIERTVGLLTPQGLLGAITSRAPFFLGTMHSFRENVLQHSGFINYFADLGEGVLEATVETAAYIVQTMPMVDRTAVFFRHLVEKEKDAHLLRSIQQFRKGHSENSTFLAHADNFKLLSGSPFCYWVSKDTLSKLSKHFVLEGNIGSVKVGLQTGEDLRFLRLTWEVPASYVSPQPLTNYHEKNHIVEKIRDELLNGSKWVVFSKTDYASPWYSPIFLVVDWENDGLEIKSFTDDKGKLRSRPQNLEFYFRPGFSYMLRSTRLVPYIVPSGVIPTAGRAQVYPNKGEEYALLGYCASNIASAIARFSGESFARPKYQAGMIQGIPVPDLSTELTDCLTVGIEREVINRRRVFQAEEPYQEFLRPALLEEIDLASSSWDLLTLIGRGLEIRIAQAFGMSESQLSELGRDIQEAVAIRMTKITQTSDEDESVEDEDSEANVELIDSSPKAKTEGLLSYVIGTVYGRWDIRIGKDIKLAPKQQHAFEPLPVYPPGGLVDSSGMPVAGSGKIVSEAWLRARPDAITLPPMDEHGFVIGEDGKTYPATIPDDEYPIQIQWDGILVDDPGLDGKTLHPADIVRRVREALAVLWPENHDSIEAEACEILGVSDLREYFRKPSGFFADHLKRYTKSRRQAPIYWPLSTASGRYTLWIYYHRLSGDILYTAANRYLEPKIAQVERRMAELQAGLSAPLTSGKAKASSRLRDELDDLRGFLAELHSLRDELLRIAALPYKPDLNDGVILNAAPFHKLFRLSKWAKDTEATWKKLANGEYDWAHIAYTTWPGRVREACKRDKSIAIAHGLEELYVEAEGKGKKGRKKKSKEEEVEQGEMDF